MNVPCEACYGRGSWTTPWHQRLSNGAIHKTVHCTKLCRLCAGTGQVASDAPAIRAELVSDGRRYKVTVTAPDGKQLRCCISSDRYYALHDAGVCDERAQGVFIGYPGHRLVIEERTELSRRYVPAKRTRSFRPAAVWR